MQKIFSYPVKTDELNQNQYKYTLCADKDELKDITDILQVENVRSFRAEIYLKKFAKNNQLKVWGEVEAEIELKSVISLENFSRKLKIPFELNFDTEATYEDIRDIDTGINDDVPDIIINNTINLADICIEQIALNLEDYPRAEGEEFNYSQYTNYEPQKAENPFAILKNLKK